MDSKLPEITKLENIIKNCTKCPLHKSRIQAVPGHGNPKAKLVFIGEAPGRYEDEQGLPFVGKSGKLLDFMLSQIKMERKDVWIGNIVKCRPPANRDPTPKEIETCKPYLTEQLRLLNPKVIATLGRFSMNYFLPEAKISQIHGKPQILKSSQGKFILYPLYHPAAGLRNGKIKLALIEDFLKIPKLLK